METKTFERSRTMCQKIFSMGVAVVPHLHVVSANKKRNRFRAKVDVVVTSRTDGTELFRYTTYAALGPNKERWWRQLTERIVDRVIKQQTRKSKTV